jgi:hypothetical protein
MIKISKERAEELDAAWKAASDIQRLRLHRLSWFAGETVSYYEEKPSRLELVAADYIDELEKRINELVSPSQSSPPERDPKLDP